MLPTMTAISRWEAHPCGSLMTAMAVMREAPMGGSLMTAMAVMSPRHMGASLMTAMAVMREAPMGGLTHDCHGSQVGTHPCAWVILTASQYEGGTWVPHS